MIARLTSTAFKTVQTFFTLSIRISEFTATFLKPVNYKINHINKLKIISKVFVNQNRLAFFLLRLKLRIY